MPSEYACGRIVYGFRYQKPAFPTLNVVCVDFDDESAFHCSVGISASRHMAVRFPLMIGWSNGPHAGLVQYSGALSSP